jgi:hypothetical protein
LQANKLIVLKLSSFEYGGLLFDILLDSMREIIVDFIGVVEG